MDRHIDHKVVLAGKGDGVRQLICEEPLSIRLQGKPYSVVMRTPGEEIAHVAGFCLAEGIVDHPDDFGSIAFCDGGDTNVVTVTLAAERRQKVPELLERRGYISQTSCGICGKELVEDLGATLLPMEKGSVIDFKRAAARLEGLSENQPLRASTRAAHAAAVYGDDYGLMSIAEDVGRHNALDKAVGKLFLEGTLGHAAFLTLSSRISYELVQKAARAGIPAILALSRPTALAVTLAEKLDIALVSHEKGVGYLVFCCPHRFIGIS